MSDPLDTTAWVGFVDPIHADARVHLVIGTDGLRGVGHPDCDQLADVSLELDAFYCSACRWNGRVSGAWVVDQLEAART